MAFQKFELIDKKSLTPDIFEITYKCENKIIMKPWQFITFILPEIWWRAYSILEAKWNNIKLIIKRWSKEMLWRWWSIMLCDAKIWETFNWVWPAGHFVLKPENNAKLFLWTGTGFVPLYNQIVATLENWNKSKITFVFWVREVKWMFYIDELNILKQKYPNFDFRIYISREESLNYEKWYITDYLSKDTVNLCNEFYICWAPLMIESAVSMLDELWVDEKSVFFEKY